MINFTRTPVLVTLLMGITLAAFSQQALRVPSELKGYLKESTYDKLYGSNNMSDILNSKATSEPWIAWADRDQAGIYASINGATPVERADFMEEFKILEAVREGWFRVGRQTVAGLQSVGWMRANELILHCYALQNQYAGAQKRMILTPLSEAKKAARLSDVTFTKFLRMPERGSAKHGEARRFSIFFVIKTEKDSRGTEFALLASSSSFRPSAAKNEILGWIPASALTEWNSRVGLDFASGSIASKAYGDTPIIVADSEGDAVRFHRNESVSTPMQSGTVSESPRVKITKSPFPDIRLTDESLGIHEVVAILGKGANGTVNSELSEEVKKYFDALETINLFFIIDGTMSMQPYIDVVKSLATNIAAFNTDRDKHIRMGFAVYRDFPDGEQKRLEVFQVTDELTQFQSRIAQIQCISSDRDKAEAFYQGISGGLAKSLMQPDQTNLVILLGDVGNHQTTTYNGTNYDYNGALAQLKRLNASLFVYQVATGADWSYMDFGLDAARFARDLGGGKRAIIRRNDGYELERDAADPFQPYAQIYLGDKTGRSVSTKSLENSLKDILNEYIRLREDLARKIEDAFGPGGMPPDSKWVSKVCDDMVRSGLPRSACDLLTMQNVAAKGFVSVRTQERDVRCFTPYIFFTYNEIKQMEHFMTALSRPITGDEAGKQLSQVFLQITKAISGDDDDSSFAEWTVEQVWREFFQLPCGLSFAKTRIKDLPTQLNAVCGAGSGDQLCAEIAEMQDAAKKFNQRYADWKWQPNVAVDDKFFWIPLRYFPGADAKD